MKAVVPSWRRDLRKVLGENKVFPARDTVWSVTSAERGSMDNAVAHRHPSQHIDPVVLDFSSASLVAVDPYDDDLDADRH